MTNELVPSSGQRPIIQLSPFDQDIKNLLASQLGASSIAMYKRDIKAYQSYTESVQKDPLQVETFKDWRNYLTTETTMSPNTINRMMSAVKRILKEAAPDVFIHFDQVPGVKVKALKKRLKQNGRVRISKEDMRRLCEAPNASTNLGKRDRALLATLASSGGRASEIASLTPEQIIKQGDNYIIQVCGKTDIEYRDAHLSREAFDLITIWLAARNDTDSTYIFTPDHWRGNKYQSIPLPRSENHITVAGIWRLVQKYAKHCDLEHIKPHDFRRYVGTQLAAKDIRKAQLALGHKSIEVTARSYVLDQLEAGETNDLY